MLKYTKLLTPEEYEKLSLDEKAEYITAMATVLKSRVPPRDPPPDATNQPQDDPPPDATNQPQDDPPAPGATNQPQDDPPPRDAADEALDEPSRTDDKPKEARSPPN